MITKTLIDKFYEDVELLGLKFPVAAISKQTGFGKGQVSDYLKKNKVPSENFLSAFYKAFESSINVPRATQKPKEPVPGDKSELLDIMRERIKELKEDKDWLKKNLEFSLTGIAIGNKSILAHVATILEKDNEREAGGNKKKEHFLKEDADRRIGEKLSGFQQMDNSLNT